MKMKNSKTFYKAQTVSHLRKLFSLPQQHPTPCNPADLWNKNFYTEIYRNIQTFAFRVLQECSCSASRSGPVQMLFWHQPDACCKIWKSRKKLKRFLAAVWEHIFSVSNGLSFRK